MITKMCTGEELLMDNKQMEYAKDLRSDFSFCLESGEDKVVSKGEVETIKWLVEQAIRADMYKSALMNIGSIKGVENPSFLANSTLWEADQRFERNEVKS
jgi:hypothetical protein